MAASFYDLPIELWLLITCYLTETQLSEFKSVNSLFLNCWMDFRWNVVNVVITARYSKSANRLLTRLVDPFVAVRVKRLSIWLNSKKLASPSSSRMSFSAILMAIPLLPNVTSVDIELIGHSAFHVTTFLQTITSSAIPRTLQKLMLKGTVDAYASLGVSAHNTPFENLTELALDLRFDDNPFPQAGFSLTLEPLLRSPAQTLQILRIYTRSPTLDLSPLFDALSQSPTPVLFPNLKSLSVSLHFNINFRSFPQSLNNFLLTHHNLQHLHLDLLSFWRHAGDEESMGGHLAELLNNDSQYSSLQSLEIYPSTSQAGLSAVLALVRRNAHTLSSLKIFDRRLTFGEVQQLVDALSPSPITNEEPKPKKLKTLFMCIAHLSVPCLNLLARNIPQLDKLSLEVDRVNRDSFCNSLDRRRYNPNTTSSRDILHTWKLHELCILKDWINRGDLVRAVAGAVPALSCWMEGDYTDDDDDG